MQINTLGANLSNIDFSSMDVETALMTIQTQRAQLLEDSLRAQLEGVNDRNKLMERLGTTNTEIGQANRSMEAANAEMTRDIANLKNLQGRLQESKCPDSEGWYGLSWGQGDDPALSHATLAQIKDMGLDVPTGADAPRDVDSNGTMDAKGRVVQDWIDQIGKKVEVLEAKLEKNEAAIKANEGKIEDNKNQIDSLGNAQQMEMLRLQTLTNKRNEAFDVMTNFIKKMQDSRSSIVGNMR